MGGSKGHKKLIKSIKLIEIRGVRYFFKRRNSAARIRLLMEKMLREGRSTEGIKKIEKTRRTEGVKD